MRCEGSSATNRDRAATAASRGLNHLNEDDDPDAATVASNRETTSNGKEVQIVMTDDVPRLELILVSFV